MGTCSYRGELAGQLRKLRVGCAEIAERGRERLVNAVLGTYGDRLCAS